MPNSAMARVLSCPDILPQILVRVGTTRDLVRCVAVDPTWMQSVSNQLFVQEYVELHAPSLVGFLAEFETPIDPLFEVIEADVPPGSDTVRCLLNSIDFFDLAQSSVLSSRDGFLLTKSRDGLLGYFTSCAFDSPRILTFAGTNIPPLPHFLNQFSVNTLGQFGVIPNVVPGGMAFFDVDPPGDFIQTNDGISFNSSSMFHSHVCVYSNNAWQRFISQPIPPPTSPVIFHKKPYCVLNSNIIFMMYAVGIVVAFDLSTNLFSVIPLPEVLAPGLVSDKSYALVEHSNGGLFLAHWRIGSIYTWVLSIGNGELVWDQIEIIEIMDIFHSCFGPGFWEDFFCDGTAADGFHNFHGIQLRSVTRGGDFIFLSVGYDRALFILDCKKKTIRKIDAAYGDGEIGSVFLLTEPWPPRVLSAAN